MREKILEFNAKATDFNTIWYMYTHVYFRGVIPWGGGYFGVKRIGMTVGNSRKLP